MRCVHCTINVLLLDVHVLLSVDWRKHKVFCMIFILLKTGLRCLNLAGYFTKFLMINSLQASILGVWGRDPKILGCGGHGVSMKLSFPPIMYCSAVQPTVVGLMLPTSYIYVCNL